LKRKDPHRKSESRGVLAKNQEFRFQDLENVSREISRPNLGFPPRSDDEILVVVPRNGPERSRAVPKEDRPEK